VDSISQVLSKLDGELDVQLERTKNLSAKLGSLENSLSDIEEIDARCHEANIEENDYTVFSVDDLKFELELVKQSVNKKSAFIENQVIFIKFYYCYYCLESSLALYFLFIFFYFIKRWCQEV
jgi:hypothetical protein